MPLLQVWHRRQFKEDKNEVVYGKDCKKLNFLIEEAVYRDMEILIAVGKRSRFVNDALRMELEAVRRKVAVEKLIDATSKIRRVSNTDIAERLAMDPRKHR